MAPAVARWDDFHAKVFNDICVEEILAHNRAHGNLNSVGYANLVRKFYDRTQTRYSKNQMKGRWAILKRQYTQWKTLNVRATGLGRDPVTGCIVADAAWWEQQNADMPRCIRFKDTPLQDEDKMRIMFDDISATDETSFVPPSGGANLGVGDGEERSEGERDGGRNDTPASGEERSEDEKKMTVVYARKKKPANKIADLIKMDGPQQSPGSTSTFTPPLFNTYFRTPFQASAFATPTAACNKPTVKLVEWWLERPAGHEDCISVGGYFERNQGIWEFTAGVIAERHDPCVLETEDGVVVSLCGFFNRERTCGNGFTFEACEKFWVGFPLWWDDWKLHCPNMMISRTGSQSTYSRTDCNSREDSNVDSTKDDGVVGIDNASQTIKECRKTSATLTRRQALRNKTVPGEAALVASSGKGKQPVGPSRKQRSASGKLQHATRSTYDDQLKLTRGMAKSPSPTKPEFMKLKKTKSGRVVVPALDPGSQKIVYSSVSIKSLLHV